jgi:hypothetical protein
MLPDVGFALADWEVAVKLKTVSQQSEDFVRADVVTVEDALMVVQVQDPAKLKAEGIDWSLTYLRFHSRTALAVGQYVEHEGGDYKIIKASAWASAGYWEAVGVQTRKPLLVAEDP